MADFLTSGTKDKYAGQNAGLILTVPSNVQAGDLAIAMVFSTGTTAAHPSGWSTNPPGGTRSYVMWRSLTSSDPGATYTFNVDISAAAKLVWVIYRGQGLTVDAIVDSENTNTTTAPTVTTSATNEVLVHFFGTLASSATWTSPPGETLRYTAPGSFLGPAIVTDVVQGPAGPSATSTASGGGGNARTATVAIRQPNTAPNAPTVTVPSTIDSGSPNVITAPFSDPDAGDTCSQTDFQWWDLDSTGARVGAAHTQTVTGAQPTQWTAPAGTFTNGNKEIQAKSYDALGVASAWGASAFFTAATPTGMPTITDPTNGATVGQTPYTVAWTTAGGQKGYQVRRVKDNAGAADATTVYWDSGQVTDANARSLSVPFETTGRYEHVQVSVTADGSLWSAFADARVDVSYTAPMAPTFTVDLDPASGSALVSITNPAPASGEPSVSYNIVETDDGDSKGFSTRPGSSMVAPNTAYRYWAPPSGFDPAAHVRVTAVGTNGVTSSTTSPLNVTDGNSPANTTTTISDGGVVL